MRLIDKLMMKKANAKQMTLAEVQPLLIKKEEGKNIRVFFGGLCYVYDKLLHNALIEYETIGEKTIKKEVLLEPVTREYDDGTIEDNTERYFKHILDSANMLGNKEIYTALMDFFDIDEIDEKAIKSDYIGVLSQYDNGAYYRFFDDEFRIKYVREKIDQIA